eukprot:sb/3470633/
MKAVGFIHDVTPGNPSLFVAGYVSSDGDFTNQEGKMPAVANRHLVNMDTPDQSFSYYTNEINGSPPFQRYQRSWHVKSHMEVNFVSAFPRDGYAYYVFSERQFGMKGGVFQTRLARTCLSDQGKDSLLKDSTYTSYIEIPLTCQSEGDEFPTVRSVTVTPADGFYQGDAAVLVGIFAKGQNQTKSSAICAFSFDEVCTTLF